MAAPRELISPSSLGCESNPREPDSPFARGNGENCIEGNDCDSARVDWLCIHWVGLVISALVIRQLFVAVCFGNEGRNDRLLLHLVY